MTHKVQISRWRRWCSFALTTYAVAIWAALSLFCNRNNVSARSSTVIEQPLDRFADDIKAFERADIEHPVGHVALLFVGSSTFAHVASALQDNFESFSPLVRAFGGSTIPEINYYVEQVVLKYQPSRICFYAGTNDIADGHSGTRVFEDFVKFAEIIHTRLPKTEILFVSMSMAPSRVQWHKQYSIGNKLVKRFARRNPFVRFIDVTHVMYDAWGNLRTDWFQEDQLHMNALGYAAWFPIIRNALTPG